MFASVLGQLVPQLDRRFILNAFFPTLVFVMLTGMLVISGAAGLDDAITWWDRQSTIVRVVLTVGAIAAVFVLANIVAASMLWIVRVFEGYAFPASLFATPARRFRYARWDGKSEADKKKMRARFPEGASSADQVAPTRLGNILLSAERYPSARYHVDSKRTWPRLYHLLPEELRTALEEARSSMELLLAIAFLSGLFSVVGSVCLLAFEASTAWVLAALFGGASVSAITYAGALAPASIYGNLIRTAYDLHRHALIEALRLPCPATPGEERIVWSGVLGFLDGDDPDYSWRYVVSD